jgi:hypothetical protein
MERLNKTHLMTISPENMATVIGIFNDEIIATLKPEVLAEMFEYFDNKITLDAIKDKITTAQLLALVQAGIVIERVIYRVELNPALADYYLADALPGYFPNDTIPEVVNEDESITPARKLTISEYFRNELLNDNGTDRFFIELNTQPKNIAQNSLAVKDLPNSTQIIAFIAEVGANVLNHYSIKAFNELKATLNAQEVV